MNKDFLPTRKQKRDAFLLTLTDNSSKAYFRRAKTEWNFQKHKMTQEKCENVEAAKNIYSQQTPNKHQPHLRSRERVPPL